MTLILEKNTNQGVVLGRYYEEFPIFGVEGKSLKIHRRGSDLIPSRYMLWSFFRTGRIIAAAYEAEQYGWDYLFLGNMLWGYWFIDQGLLANNAESVESAHKYAYPHVIDEQPYSLPQLYDNYPGDFRLK